MGIKKLNPIYLKSGWPIMKSLLIMYFITVIIMWLDRRYKHFDQKGNEYAQESEVAKKNRLLKYTIIKGQKQKLVWKNFIRAMTTSYQPIMFSIFLNIKQGSLLKPYL